LPFGGRNVSPVIDSGRAVIRLSADASPEPFPFFDSLRAIMVSRSPPLFGLITAFAGIYLIWGTTYLAIAFALQTLPPFVSSCLRFLLAGVLLLIWLRARDRRPFRGVPLLQAVLCGVLMAGVGNGFVVWAQQGVPSGVAALMVAATPVVVLLLDWIAFTK